MGTVPLVPWFQMNQQGQSPGSFRLTPHASRLMPHASCLMPHASCLTEIILYPWR